nr:hypothetical protein 35 [bacterium]
MNSSNIFGAIIAIMGLTLLALSQAQADPSMVHTATRCAGSSSVPCTI